MPIEYTKRRELWLRQTEQWPPILREKVSVRNIKAVLRLPANARSVLAEALGHNDLSVPASIEYLNAHPHAAVQDLLTFCRPTRATGKHWVKGDTRRSESDAELPERSPSHLPDPRDIAALADLYQFAHPGAHRIVAEAWAEDPKWAGLLDLVHAWQAHIERPSSMQHSETTIVVTCAFLVKAREQLKRIIAERPAYQQALKMSGVPMVDTLAQTVLSLQQSPDGVSS